LEDWFQPVDKNSKEITPQQPEKTILQKKIKTPCLEKIKAAPLWALLLSLMYTP
jgi:hypothetical protein